MPEIMRNVALSILDLTEIEFALEERMHRLQAFADATHAPPDDVVFVLLERDRSAIERVRAAL